MGKKRLDHQYHHHHHQTNNLQHQQPDHHHQQDQGKKRSSEESQLLHKLNTHFKKLSKARTRISPASLDNASCAADKDAAAAAAAVATAAMHACNYYESPCSSSSTRIFDVNDDDFDHDHNHRHAGTSVAVVAFKFGQLDYCCSGESESVTTSFFVATENEDLFGGENTFAPDLNAAHNLVHVEFVEDKDGVGFGAGYYLTDPIGFFDGSAKYSSEMLKLSSQEDMIHEFLKNNLFD